MARTPSRERIRKTLAAERLADSDLSYAQIAEQLGVSERTVREMLQGYQRKPKGKNLAPAPYRRGYVYGAGI
jgi:predicted transcriptional regulator